MAIEACGEGALVDEQHRFAMHTGSDCELRVVWERDDHRAEGPWHPLDPRGSEVVEVLLPMPKPTALKPLSQSEQQYREAAIREAQRNLEASDEAEESTQGPPPPGV